MATIVVDTMPACAQQSVAREKRQYLSRDKAEQKKPPSAAQQAKKDLKVSLSCKDHNLVTLWILTLGLNWQKGKKKDNETLTTALYADLEQRGFHVENTTWTAYRKVRNLRFFGLLTETIIFQRGSVQVSC